MRKIKFLFYYLKILKLENKLMLDYFTNFNKTKRLTMWYFAGKNKGYIGSIDYAFYKVYHLWGMDSLTEEDKKGFWFIFFNS